MWFNEFVKSIMLFFASRLWPRKKKEPMEVSTDEKDSGHLELLGRLDRLETQVFHLGCKIEAMARLHEDLIKQIVYQTSVAEELSLALDSLPGPSPVQVPEPKIKVVAEIQQKAKKQILN